MLQLETTNRKAFDYYDSAIRKIDGYNKTLDTVLLDAAANDLDLSIRADGNFFRAANYKGIVFDLMGMATEAIRQFDTIVQNTPDIFKGEVWYNKAIANYHLYHEPNLEAAIGLLNDVIAKYPRNRRLTVLAEASLAQCYGMMVLHAVNMGDMVQVGQLRDDVLQRADKTLVEVGKLENRRELGEDLVKEVSWIAYNAKGIALMFQDDNARDSMQPGKSDVYRENLEQALNMFRKGQEFAPDHWALACNVASAEMRMGYWSIRNNDAAKAADCFTSAITGLQKVIDVLKPGYDFAYYEIGRVYRLWSKFNEASTFLNKAKSISGYNKSVGNKTIDMQLEKADRRDATWAYTAHS